MSTRRAYPNGETARSVGLWDVVAFVWRGALFALFVAVLAGGTAFLVTRRAPPVYRATAALLASQPGSSYGSLGLVTPPQVDPGVYQTALLEGPVARQALQSLRGAAPTARELERFLRTVHVAVQRQDVSAVVRITVDATDPALAAATANALADGLVSWDRDRALQLLAGSVAALERAIADLDSQLASPGLSAERRQTLQALRGQRGHQLEAALATSEASVVVGLLEPLSTATPPAAAFAPRVLFKTGVAVLLGLGIAYALLLLRLALDPTVRGRADLAALTDLPVLAAFPRPAGGSGRGRPRLVSEAAGFLAAGLQRAAGGDGPLVVVVTSPHASRAKEGVALALARSLAGSEGRTLLVDADLRHTGSAHGLDPSTVRTPPLEVYLENPDQPHAPAHLPAGGRRVLDFVPSFTAATQPVELLQRGFGRLIEDWRERYDAIVIDAPPLLPFADTLAVAPWSSGVVLCAAQRWSRRDDVVESLAILHDQGIPALGTVLTRAPGDRRRQVAVRAGHPVDDTEVPPADPYVTLAHPRGMQKVRVKER